MSAVLPNINLYLPEFRKKKQWLDAEKTVLLAAAGVIVLIIASGVEYWELLKLRWELADKEVERQEIATATSDLIDQYGVQTEDPALLANIRELEEDLQSKQALLQFLEGRELGNTEGFSEYLADLSRYHVAGLSLTAVSLANGGRSVVLEGQVLQAELVPIYLQNLSKGRVYAGKNFEMLQIENAGIASAAEDGTASGMPIWNFQVRSADQ